MSMLYEMLKKRATDKETKDKIIYVDYNDSMVVVEDDIDVTVHRRYTYKDLFERVNDYMHHIVNEFDLISYKTCFAIDCESYENLCLFIALQELGLKPIIISEKKIFDLYYKDSSSVKADDNYKYQILIPEKDNVLEKESKYKRIYLHNSIHSFVPLNNTLAPTNFDRVVINNQMSFALDERDISRILNHFIKKNNMDSFIKSKDYDFAILTSGITSEFNLMPIKEKDFFNKIINNYELNNEEKLINTTPTSSISGLTFGVFLPIISGKKTLYSCYDYKKILTNEDGSYSIVLPGDVDSMQRFHNDENDEIIRKRLKSNQIKMNHIYLIGKRITPEVIEKVHTSFPGIEEDCIYNYYGNTENLGLVCKCNQKDLIPVYIYGLNVSDKHIVYSFDKENVYEKNIIDGKEIISKSKVKYSDLDFIPVYPISANYNEDSKIIKVKEGIFNELIINGMESKDYGFVINNSLYFLGRQSEFIKKDNHYECVCTYENLFKVLCDINCYAVKVDDKVNIYIPMTSPTIMEQRYKNYENIYYAVKEIVDYYNLPVNDVYTIDQYEVPKTGTIKKIKKEFLLNYKENQSDKNIVLASNENLKLAILNSQISNYFNREVSLRELDDYFYFDKDEFNIMDILNIILRFKVIDFRESENCYELKFEESFFNAQPPSVYEIKSVEELITEYLKMHRRPYIRLRLRFESNRLKIEPVESYNNLEIKSKDLNNDRYIRYLVRYYDRKNIGTYFKLPHCDIEYRIINIPYCFKVNKMDNQIELVCINESEKPKVYKLNMPDKH